MSKLHVLNFGTSSSYTDPILILYSCPLSVLHKGYTCIFLNFLILQHDSRVHGKRGYFNSQYLVMLLPGNVAMNERRTKLTHGKFELY